MADPLVLLVLKPTESAEVALEILEPRHARCSPPESHEPGERAKASPGPPSILAAENRRCRAAPVRIVALACFGAFCVLVVAVHRRMSTEGADPIDVPLCHLAFAYGVASYFTSGMETPLVLLAGAAFAAFSVAPRARAPARTARGLDTFLVSASRTALELRQ